MKQRLLKALSLAAIALCSATATWADRVAPTLPPAVEPQNEQCYWIYCPEAEKFVGSSSGSTYAVLTEKGNDIYLVETNENWQFRKNSLSGYYLYDGFIDLTWSSYNSSSVFNLKSNGSSYIIQGVGKTKYVGYNADNKYLNVNSESAVAWQFMNTDKAAHYAAEKALYNALEATDNRGWIRDQYEQIYSNRATATTLELNQAADALNHALSMNEISGLFHSENDYPNIMLSSSQDWKYSGSSGEPSLTTTIQPGQTSIITATVETTELADLSYKVRDDKAPVYVYVDGEEVRAVSSRAGSSKTFFNSIAPGKHVVEFVFKNEGTEAHSSVFFYSIGVENTPLITVNCPLPGSLGTEILYNVDHVKDVRNLKVIGELNSDDMTRLTMLTNAHYIDLSEATCTADIPYQAFSNHTWLHTFYLAEGIKSIGEYAFYRSLIENITFPSTLTTIGRDAFHYTNIKAIKLPVGVSDIKYATFQDCYNLKTAEFPGVKTIDNNAFQDCINLVPALPENLQTIGYDSFSGCRSIKNLFIPETVNNINQDAFRDCTGIEEVTLPVIMYKNVGYGAFDNCNHLKKITLKSTTVVEVSRIINDTYRPNITLCVPDYLVVPYKLDPYWYNFGDIVGFPSENIKDYTLYTDLLLDSHSRINGDPNLTIEHGALRIEGDAAMGIDNFQTTTAFYNYNHNNNFSSLSQVRSGCENITIKGDYTHKMKFYGSRWAFVSLPFDCKVSDITDLTDNHLHAVRYYDGAERAATGTGSSWKKYGSDDIIPAGQGFIIQVDGSTNDYGWVQFKSQDNASKQYVFSKKEFSKHLDKNTSNVESNQGWNLVGNPYQCYYNIHNLNFTAPITVWDGSNRTYAAYSIIDDDYALRPNEAFFVQCPSVLDAITFPVGGKQFDATILTQNASQRRATANSSRKMLNLALSNDKATDQTRIVINEEASLVYETNLDASKFMSIDNTVAQLYTLDDEGTQYAINERPFDEGFVQLGATFATDGTYTIALTRNDMESVFLTDLLTGTTTDLTLGEYTFHTTAGTDHGRFLLSFAGEDTDAIKALTTGASADYYTIDGRHVGNNRSALGKGVYVVRSGNRSAKILVD